LPGWGQVVNHRKKLEALEILLNIVVVTETMEDEMILLVSEHDPKPQADPGFKNPRRMDFSKADSGMSMDILNGARQL